MIIKLAMCFGYYIFSATPTTDILRLLKGSQSAINTINSRCASCNHIIRHWEQLPIMSYLLSRGKCRYCNEKIPKQSLFLEAATFCMMVGVTAAFQFRFIGVALSFLCYELMKAGFILRYGAREKSFLKELIISLGYNVGFFGLFAFMSLLLYV
jgi:prepilin signal peptidase PulO-like enzyme (type II secretory pathway)